VSHARKRAGLDNQRPSPSRTSDRVIARRRGFHDHAALDINALQGSITIQ